MIFLDNNSTTQIDPRVLKEIIPYFNQKYGNPSSNSHKFGWEANDAIDISRKKISNLINSSPNEIIFTSGATESNNLATSMRALTNSEDLCSCPKATAA